MNRSAVPDEDELGDLTRGIERVVSEGTGTQREVTRKKVQKWIQASTSEQLAVLTEVLDSFDYMSGQEKFVVASALEPLTYLTGHTGVAYEVLALRSAFCSPWAVASNPGVAVGNFDAYVLGIRENKAPLDCSNEKPVKENIALLRFAFELRKRAPRGSNFTPTKEVRVGVERFAFQYENDELKRFIRSHHGKVGELIDLALSHETCDPERLSVLLGYSGPAPLSSGTL